MKSLVRAVSPDLITIGAINEPYDRGRLTNCYYVLTEGRIQYAK